MSFVSICRIFGDVGESFRRNQMTATRVRQLKNDLYAWIGELPQELRLFHQQPGLGLNTYNFEARQTHVIYFVVLILLTRKSTSSSPGTLLAASFIAAIFDEFLVRDEINHLGPGIYKFFLLTAGITLLPACADPLLQTHASEDYDTIKKALKQFADRYPSSLATIHTLNTLESAQEQTPQPAEHLGVVESETRALFRQFGPGLCRQWHLLEGSQQPHRTQESLSQLPESQGSDPSQSMPPPSYLAPLTSLPFGGEPFDVEGIPLGTDLDSGWLTSWAELPDPTSWVLKDTPFDLGDDYGFLGG